MSEQKENAEQKKEIVWANCTRKGCENNQAEKLPVHGQPAIATFVRFKCTVCGHVWQTPLGAAIVTDI